MPELLERVVASANRAGQIPPLMKWEELGVRSKDGAGEEIGSNSVERRNWLRSRGYFARCQQRPCLSCLWLSTAGTGRTHSLGTEVGLSSVRNRPRGPEIKGLEPGSDWSHAT